VTSTSEENQNTELDLSDYLELFLEEAEMFLATLRHSLIRLTENPEDDRSLREAHRAAHTLAGMASTMRYEDLAALAKTLERRLESELVPPPDQIKVLLAGCDEFERGLQQLGAGNDGCDAKDSQR
jgi:two-component system chemotaxis sensor kinase CheA